MKEKPYPKAQAVISAVGLAALGLLFVLWLRDGRHSTAELAAALGCVILFALVCLRFVPEWFSFWFGKETGEQIKKDPQTGKPIALPALFGIGILWALCNYFAVWTVLRYVNQDLTAEQFLQFWKSADA